MLDKEYLKNIVLDQRERLDNTSIGFPRDKLENISNLIKHKTNVVVTGHRRSGKSTFLLQWMNKYYDKFHYLDFSDDRLVGFETKDFQTLYEVFIELYGDNKIFFFDELQGTYDWNKFVNRLYSSGYRFFITGSNADLLSKEISTFLTGRHMDVIIFPFSFKEYLSYRTDKKNINLTKDRILIEKEFKKYLEIGGFPEVIVYGSRDILNEVYNDVLNRDILQKYSIKNEVTFKKMSLYLLSNFAKEFSYTSLKNNFQLGSTNTAKNYVSYLNNSYVLFELNKYDYSLKKQETYSKKIYCIDHGILNELTFAFSENKGRLYENIVFIELLRRNKEVYYWKNNQDKEVDFLVVEKSKVTELIQVCYDISNEKTKNREISSLLLAMNEFNLKEGLILTNSYDAKEMYDNKKIVFKSLYKWLLE